jgi:predicted ATP-dependent serine protease
MASTTFVRARSSEKGNLPGSKPGRHGQTLVSTGVQEWDNLLGGGLQLGTLMLLLGDRWAPQLQELLLKHALGQVTIG